MRDRGDDQIPAVAVYRGCGIEDQQSEERIERIVKPAIDYVHGLGLDDAEALAVYAGHARNPPEARQLAAARVEAIWQLAAEGKRNRPPVDMDKLRGSVAGLGSLSSRDPYRYSSLWDAWQRDRAVERETPLRDDVDDE